MPGYKHPCRYCGQLVGSDVNVCPFCGKNTPTGPLRCPQCRSPIEEGWKACSCCGAVLIQIDLNNNKGAAPPTQDATLSADKIGNHEKVSFFARQCRRLIKRSE